MRPSGLIIASAFWVTASLGHAAGIRSIEVPAEAERWPV